MTAIEHLRALYAPGVEELRRPLSEAADGLHAQLCELSARPTRDKCDRLAANLDGARRHVLRLGEALGREAAE